MVDIKTIVLENNLDDLPKLYKLCQDMDFKFLSISFLRNNELRQNSCLRESFGEEFYAQKYPVQPYFDMEHFKEVYKELKSIKNDVHIRFSPKFEGGDELGKIEKFFHYVNIVNSLTRINMHNSSAGVFGLQIVLMVKHFKNIFRKIYRKLG